jgi:hypothetical protein
MRTSYDIRMIPRYRRHRMRKSNNILVKTVNKQCKHNFINIDIDSIMRRSEEYSHPECRICQQIY